MNRYENMTLYFINFLFVIIARFVVENLRKPFQELLVCMGRGFLFENAHIPHPFANNLGPVVYQGNDA